MSLIRRFFVSAHSDAALALSLVHAPSQMGPPHRDSIEHLSPISNPFSDTVQVFCVAMTINTAFHTYLRHCYITSMDQHLDPSNDTFVWLLNASPPPRPIHELRRPLPSDQQCLTTPSPLPPTTTLLPCTPSANADTVFATNAAPLRLPL